MATFDVFVNGINPEFADDRETVLEKASKRLQISVPEVEDIVSKPGGSCITRSVSEDEALKFQNSLNSIGLICVYRPGGGGLELTLEAIETEEERSSVSTCPNCEQSLPKDEDGNTSDNCDNCGIIVSKFLENKKLEAEKEEIRELLMRSKNAQRSREQKEKEEEEKKKRKQQLEKEILEENPDLIDENASQKKLLLVAGVVVILLAVIFLIPSSPEVSVDDSQTDLVVSDTEISDEDTLATSDYDDSFEDDYSSEPMDGSLETDSGQNTEFDSATNENAQLAASPNQPVSDMQGSLQNTHAQATEVMNAFGLDPNAFANAAGGQQPSVITTDPALGFMEDSGSPAANTNDAGISEPSAPQQIVLNNSFSGDESLDALDAELEKIKDASSQDSKAVVPSFFPDVSKKKDLPLEKPISSPQLAEFLLRYGVDHQEWDHFLLQQIDRKTQSNNLSDAKKLAAYLTQVTNYVDSLSKIFLLIKSPAEEAEIMQAFQAKIQQYSALDQIKHLAMFGVTQFKHKGSSELISQAEVKLNQLSNTEEKLEATLSIAVAYFQAGQSQLAQTYFNKVNRLNAEIKNADSQVKVRMSIAKAYKQVGAVDLAMQWAMNAETISQNAGNIALDKLIAGFAYLEDPDAVIRIAQLARTDKQKDIQYYYAIQRFLESSQLSQAKLLVDSIKTPAYQALSYALIASYDQDDSRYLALAEATLVLEVNASDEKAVLASRLAQLFARQQNSEKAKDFLKMTQQQMKEVTGQNKYQSLMNIVTVNYLRSLDQSLAMNLADSIESPAIKSQFYKSIITMGKINELI